MRDRSIRGGAVRRVVDWRALIALVLIGIFTVTLATAYFFPIYPDEIAARFWLSRLPYDLPYKISNMPTCTSGWSQRLSVTWYVPAGINWLLEGNVSSLRTLRVTGIAVWLVWGAGLMTYTRFRFWPEAGSGGWGRDNNAASYLYAAGLIISVFSLGVSPLFFILNRNEQLLLPSIATLMGLFLLAMRLREEGCEKERRGWLLAGMTATYFVAVSLIVYGHPKGLFLTPFFLLVGWSIARLFGTRLAVGAATFILTAQIEQGYAAWVHSFQCAEMPGLSALLKSFSFDPLSLIYTPARFMHQAVGSILRFNVYLHQIGFQRYTDINYLPPLPLGPIAHVANMLIWTTCAVAFVALFVLLPLSYYRNDLRHRRYLTANAALITLTACVVAGMVFNVPKNWYDAGYVFGEVATVWLFTLAEYYRGLFQKPAGRALLAYLACVSLLSQSILIHRYLPAFLRGYAGPGVSLVTYNYERTNADMAAVSRACHISRRHSNRLIVDDLTYLYYKDSRFPMPITYIYLENSPAGIKRFVNGAASSGLVVRCSELPASWLPFTIRKGGICGLAGSALPELPLPVFRQG